MQNARDRTSRATAAATTTMSLSGTSYLVKASLSHRVHQRDRVRAHIQCAVAEVIQEKLSLQKEMFGVRLFCSSLITPTRGLANCC